jgi:hypothetical protein
VSRDARGRDTPTVKHHPGVVAYQTGAVLSLGDAGVVVAFHPAPEAESFDRKRRSAIEP